MRFSLALAVACLCLSACSNEQTYDNFMVSPANVTDTTRAGHILENLPAPSQKVPVVTYEFQDQTGQFKENGTYTDYSSAVTKGGYSILVKALLDAGHRKWFTVAERGGLKNLLQERQLINITRGQYRGRGGEKLPGLPPMLYGGLLIEGGIISYDTNVMTGGLGATYLGIGGSAQYRRDLITIYLRAINVQTGEVLTSVTSSKSLYSTSLDFNFLKYFTYDNLFQSEAGITLNEPTQLGVRQAIETGVYSLIMEGALQGIWSFQDPAAGHEAIEEYLERRDGHRDPEAERAEQPTPDNDVSEAPVPDAAPMPVVEPAPEPAPYVATRKHVPAAQTQGPTEGSFKDPSLDDDTAQ